MQATFGRLRAQIFLQNKGQFCKNPAGVLPCIRQKLTLCPLVSFCVLDPEPGHKEVKGLLSLAAQEWRVLHGKGQWTPSATDSRVALLIPRYAPVPQLTRFLSPAPTIMVKPQNLRFRK